MSDVNGTVVAIQARDVDSAAPNDGDVYRWDAGNSKWVPVAPPQPLEPWVGSVNTQSKVIQRIPWTCQTTGGASVSTGVSITLPTDTCLSLEVSMVSRWLGNPGLNYSKIMLYASDSSGTVTTYGPSAILSVGFGNAPFVTYPPVLSLSVSGSTVTLNVTHSGTGGSDVVSMQGYVDLILM